MADTAGGAVRDSASTGLRESLKAFVEYASDKYDEKGHSQNFLEHLIQAFGWPDLGVAGAILEDRVKRKSGVTNYADLSWPDREVMIEMKKRGEPLAKHFAQLRGYWLDTKGWRARWLLLCNFEEIWIYDTKLDSNAPIDRLRVEVLPERWSALGFLALERRDPLFKYDLKEASEKVAASLGGLFTTLGDRGESPERAQRFVLQCVVCLFAEDLGLLPDKLFTRLLLDCESGQSSYDLLGGLFRQMNTPTMARAGRFQGVPYFNGGLFASVDPIELQPTEITTLLTAAHDDWSQVDPAIFGTIFQASMSKDLRHEKGAHYTTESDIHKIVLPTIVAPWRQRLAETDKLGELLELREALLKYRVLDPACGSGNFLYVAYRELRRVELALLLKIRDRFPRSRAFQLTCQVSVRQFFGFDVLPFAVEVAKVTMVLAKELSIRELHETLASSQLELTDLVDPALPLENLDANIRCEDALFNEWPDVDAIVGNPPFQSKNKMQAEFGREYVNRLRRAFPDIPGRADFCVYFFRRAHDQLKPDDRAGLVGTNTIRQNYSREGGLDHIVRTGGTIVDAVSTQAWSGEAAVHVSIVNWIKGIVAGPFPLAWQRADGAWESATLATIPTSLTALTDVTAARGLAVNRETKSCFQGQTHGHEGFLVAADEARTTLIRTPESDVVLLPFLTADDMLSEADGRPRRFVIDFHPRDLFEAQSFPEQFRQVRSTVLPTREKAAEDEAVRNAVTLAKDPRARVNRHHKNFLANWWLLSYGRAELMGCLVASRRYVACSRVTKRPIFAFVHPGIRPNDSLAVFTLEDDYSFGILQSTFHWSWFMARCSTLEERFRYTSNSIYDTFPWPQDVSVAQARAVADAAVHLRHTRQQLQARHGWGLRDLYRMAESPGRNPLKDAHEVLDRAVAAAYGTQHGGDVLGFLLELNFAISASEKQGAVVVGPGLPPCVADPAGFITDDCIRMVND